MAGCEIRAENDNKKDKEIEEYWEEQRKIRAIEERLVAEQEWELKKVEILKSHAEQWHTSIQIEQFIDAVESKSRSKNDGSKI